MAAEDEVRILDAQPRDRIRGSLLDRVHFCRCGAWCRASSMLHVAWAAQHQGEGHRTIADDYRADCMPMRGGCRQCGEPTVGRLQFYCSADHREAFERDHFWNTARAEALLRHGLYAITTRPYRYANSGPVYYRVECYICFRCGEVIKGDGPEVNHIAPVNGWRPAFGCMHHQSNLEVLCHACHLQATAEQRAAGLLGAAARA